MRKETIIPSGTPASTNPRKSGTAEQGAEGRHDSEPGS